MQLLTARKSAPGRKSQACPSRLAHEPRMLICRFSRPAGPASNIALALSERCSLMNNSKKKQKKRHLSLVSQQGAENRSRGAGVRCLKTKCALALAFLACFTAAFSSRDTVATGTDTDTRGAALDTSVSATTCTAIKNIRSTSEASTRVVYTFLLKSHVESSNRILLSFVSYDSHMSMSVSSAGDTDRPKNANTRSCARATSVGGNRKRNSRHLKRDRS